MAETPVILDFSKKTEEMNKIEYAVCNEPLPDPLSNVLVRILRRAKRSSDRDAMSSCQMEDERSKFNFISKDK